MVSAAVTCALAGGCLAEAGSRGLSGEPPPAAAPRGLPQFLLSLFTLAAGKHSPAVDPPWSSIPGRSLWVQRHCGLARSGGRGKERKRRTAARLSGCAPGTCWMQLLGGLCPTCCSQSPSKDASGSFGSWSADVLHVKYLNKWICQMSPQLPGLMLKAKRRRGKLCIFVS